MGLLPNRLSEKSRYDLHQNDSADMGYREFVSPITNAVVDNHNSTDIGLDFGSGKDSAVANILTDKGFQLYEFDPFYKNEANLLDTQYDYITCCEVIEHFHQPKKEFELLHKLLKPRGRLYCMTYIYNANIDFDKWYYKNDITHTFIYQEGTLRWIAKHFNFSDIEIINRLIIFTK